MNLSRMPSSAMLAAALTSPRSDDFGRLARSYP
jgi:hypothetical protein